MSEYWVSHKKYFCKYCNIYIADDAPSRRQHETGLRHKGNVERFVRGLYKAGEKRKQDLDEEKRDMARVEQAAQAAFARDVSAGLVKPGSSSAAPVASSSSAPKKPAVRPSNPFANYSTAESLGYEDPDAERLAAEAERRRTQGVAGEWEFVDIAAPETPADEVPPVVDGELSRKREAEQEVDEEDGRRFKLRRRTLGVGLGEIYDPGIIPIKLKSKEEPTVIQVQDTSTTSSAPTTVPKWSTRGWDKPGLNQGGEAADGEASGDGHIKEEVKAEEGEGAVPPEVVSTAQTRAAVKRADGSPAPVKSEDQEIKPEETEVNAMPPTGGSSLSGEGGERDVVGT
ncbi:Uncharacterized protein C18H10.07 [Grifola frondosa]|uniref:Uncharacterized protein C18H10.07 n=1 Tax=Grifola frondosa TaxID=5627 RepID=A0A1C7M1F1_GRIFR|nr:Uncharacterized protein C18H10.07 [Grifola frondosa]